MPQIFQVLKCYQCLVFQVHQVKKSNKWECKLCGEKQSVKRHYGLGTGKECRLHVQKLNGIRGEIDDIKLYNTESDEDTENGDEIGTRNWSTATSEIKKQSKWCEYVENEVALEDENDAMFLNGTEVVLDVPKKRRKVENCFNNYKIGQSKSVNANTVEVIKDLPTCDNLVNSQLTLFSHQKVKQDGKVNTISNDYCLNVLDNRRNNVNRETNENQILKLQKTSDTDIENKYKTHTQIRDFKVTDEKDNKIIANSKQFLQPKINKNSKWAQFIEISDETVDISNKEIKNKSTPSLENGSQHIANETLFSLCNDNELDKVLDI